MTVISLHQHTAPTPEPQHTRRAYWEVVGTPIHSAENLNDALTQTGLNWGLIATELDDPITTVVDGKLVHATMPGRRIIMRDDNHTVLGMVGNRYEMVNNEIALGVSETLVEHGAEWTAGGERDHGRFVFMIVRPKGGIVNLVDKNGNTEQIDVLVQTKVGHAGKGSVEYDMRAVRRVNNVPVSATFRSNDLVGITGIDPKITIRHTRTAPDHIEDARAVMRANMDYVRGFTFLAQRLINKPLSRTQFTNLLGMIWSPPKPPTIPAGTDGKQIERLSRAFQNRLDKHNERIADCFTLWDGETFAARTAYSAYCAIAEYIEFAVKARGKSQAEAAAQRTLMDENQAVRSRLVTLLLRADTELN